MNAIIQEQIQQQMEQAVACINDGHCLPAVRHFEECARLTKLLCVDNAIAENAPPQQTQLTINA